MSLIRVLRTAQQTLTHQFRVDEQLTDAAGAVTVVVARLDGTQIGGSPFTADHPGEGTYSFALPGQPELDTLTVDWSGTVAGAAVTVRDLVEVVGGFFFGLDEVRARHSLSAAYTSAKLAETRVEVEQECERICGQEFVPRFFRVALDGNDRSCLLLPRAGIRALRAVSVGGTVYGPEQLAGVWWSESGVLELPCGWWPRGRRNVVVEIEAGMDYPPEPIRTAGMLRLKSLVDQPKSGVPSRAASFTVADGGTYRLSLPTRERVGIPDVDGPYEKFTVDPGGFA